MKKGAANVSDLEGVKSSLTVANQIVGCISSKSANGGTIPPRAMEISMDAVTDLIQSAIADIDKLKSKHGTPPSG